MYDVLVVLKFQCETGLSDYLSRFILSEAAVCQSHIQISTFKKFLHYVEILAVLEDVKHAYNVRVL